MALATAAVLISAWNHGALGKGVQNVAAGSDAAPPWLVEVVSFPTETKSMRCNGIVVGSGLVLTAGHCLAGRSLAVVKTHDPGGYAVVMHKRDHPTLDVTALLTNLPSGSVPAGIRWDAVEPGLLAMGTAFIPSRIDALGRPRAWPVQVIEAANEVLAVLPAESGACVGDSGSALVDQGGAIVGVLTRGSDTCRGRDEYIRLGALGAWLADIQADDRL